MIAVLDYTQDVLAGLNVRPYNYLNLDEENDVRAHVRLQDTEYEAVLVPFVVTIHDDGLDYDGEGNYFWDYPPCDFPVSFHQTLEAAEANAERYAGLGIERCRIGVAADYWAYRWELKGKTARQ